METSVGVDRAMQEVMSMDGAIGALLGGYDGGMVLAEAGGHPQLEYTDARFSDIARMNLDLMTVSGLDVGMEDILITYKDSFVLLRLL